MSEKVFFKIVIANYNNIAYIKKCLDSILNQAFQDFKIVIVDDVSTDFSDKFCEMYARKYQNKITYILVPKKCYAGGCRNIGIDNGPSSEYTWFVDSDDWLFDANVLQTIYNDLNKYNFPDILFIASNTTKGNIPYLIPNDITIALQKFMAPWSKCIKTSCMQKFIENRAKANDVILHLRLIDAVDHTKIACTKNICYVYNLQSTNSILSSKFKDTYLAKWSEILLIKDIENQDFLNDLCKQIADKCKANKLEKYKNLVKLYNKHGNMNEITIAMATLPLRFYTAIRTIKKLLPYCTRFCVCLNGFDTIPLELLTDKKIITVLANNNPIKDLGCDNKMYWLGDFDGYYLTVDDDIEYPENYVVSLIEKCMKYNDNAICSYHGHIYQIDDGKISTNKKTNYYFGCKYSTDIYCHRIGMGVAICNPKKIGIDKSIFLEKPKNFGDDELVAVWAQENNVPLVRVENLNVTLKDIKVVSNKDGLCFNKKSVEERDKYLASYTNWKLRTI